MAGGGQSGGIAALLDLMDEQRAALEYDFRARFHMSLESIPAEMGWGEAIRLAAIVRADPSSMLAAAMEGWAYPVPRGEAILMDIWDALARQVYKKPKPYPRPYKTNLEQKRRGDAAGRTPEQVKAILASQFGQPDDLGGEPLVGSAGHHERDDPSDERPSE